jgi:hypothetical protein
MAHVDVDTPGIRQKPPVAWWFIVPTMVKIEDPATGDMKDMITDALGYPGRRMVRPVLVDQEAVFRFEAEDTIQHGSQLLMQVSGFVRITAPVAVLRGAATISVRRCGLNRRWQQTA